MQILETNRIILREFCLDDVDALSIVLSDAETMRFYPSPYDRAGVETWITRNMSRYAKDGHGLWAMILKTSGELIGDCGPTVQEVDGTNEVELGYHLRRDRWGRGLATEAVCACRDLVFERLAVDHIISLIRPENLPSRRVAERVGMKVWKDVVWRNLPHMVYRLDRSKVSAKDEPHYTPPRDLRFTRSRADTK
jgi:RimJ/RimL family protein N-acetyltransferase